MLETATTEPDPKRWRPFLRLGKYLSGDFLERASRWLTLVSGCGTSKVPTQPESRAEWLAFFAHCHDGWKQAQKEIAEFLTIALTKLDQAQKEEKQQHRLKSKGASKHARAKVKQITLEMNVARRMLDVILWTIFAGDHSTLRRLIVDGGRHSLSKENIAVAMDAADCFNKNPQVMALSTDMLSLVHVGDLILTNREENSTHFVELKAGDKNLEIAATAEFAIRTECELFESLATAAFDENDRKHYQRVKKQTKRNHTIISTIRNEGGTDPNTGATVIINSTPEPPEYWSDRITQCYEQLDAKKLWAIAVIDKCVYLGVYSDQRMAFAGFQAWMDRQSCVSPIFNLTDSFHDLGVRPLGATLLPEHLRQKILRGDILVIMCLDLQKFIDLGNGIRPGTMRLATKSETARMRMHRMGNLMMNGRYICTILDDEVAFVGIGTRDRILFDQHSPAHLLRQRVEAGPMSRRIERKQD